MATSTPRMPVLFIGHGSPTNTLADNTYTRAWRALGQALPRPRAILVISAHWYIDATAVTAMARPRTIHDFRGFPQALFDFQYPAAGAPDVAQDVVQVLAPEPVLQDEGQWGLDHGAWSVLAHLYPQADVPVVQLSINATRPFEWHRALGTRLGALRDRGILLLASGNVVHNLGRIDRSSVAAGAEWAQRFDQATVEQMLRDPAGVANLARHPDFALAAPTTDHFLPLLYFAGAVGAAERVQTPVRGYALGSLSMTCFSAGVPEPSRHPAPAP